MCIRFRLRATAGAPGTPAVATALAKPAAPDGADSSPLLGVQPAAAEEAVVSVACGPLGAYLSLLGVRRLDFFSLDVEGAELEAEAREEEGREVVRVEAVVDHAGGVARRGPGRDERGAEPPQHLGVPALGELTDGGASRNALGADRALYFSYHVDGAAPPPRRRRRGWGS